MDDLMAAGKAAHAALQEYAYALDRAIDRAVDRDVDGNVYPLHGWAYHNELVNRRHDVEELRKQFKRL